MGPGAKPVADATGGQSATPSIRRYRQSDGRRVLLALRPRQGPTQRRCSVSDRATGSRRPTGVRICHAGSQSATCPIVVRRHCEMPPSVLASADTRAPHQPHRAFRGARLLLVPACSRMRDRSPIAGPTPPPAPASVRSSTRRRPHGRRVAQRARCARGGRPRPGVACQIEALWHDKSHQSRLIPTRSFCFAAAGPEGGKAGKLAARLDDGFDLYPLRYGSNFARQQARSTFAGQFRRFRPPPVMPLRAQASLR